MPAPPPPPVPVGPASSPGELPLSPHATASKSKPMRWDKRMVSRSLERMLKPPAQTLELRHGRSEPSLGVIGAPALLLRSLRFLLRSLRFLLREAFCFVLFCEDLFKHL